jgi:rod shape determining protein RodA
MWRSRFPVLLSPMLWVVFILVSMGLINLYSATYSLGEAKASSYFWSQLTYHMMGLVVMFIMAKREMKFYFQLAPFLYGVSLVLLVVSLVSGTVVNGTQGWIDFGFFRMQPAEIAKLGVIFMLARTFWSVKQRGVLEFRDLFLPGLVSLVPCVLVVLQKDLGSALFFILIFLTMVLVHGVRLWIVILGLIIAVGVSVVSYEHFLQPYQKQRILSFMNPELDAKGSGYQLIQAKIAVGSGEWLGKGYLRGTANKLKFLPEMHTDFIFPVLAEEWGFVGCSLALFFYFVFLFMIINNASLASNRFSLFLIIGAGSLFFWHVVINLGGVLGLIPLTGVPLPFFSYGGSSLMTSWLAIGTVLGLENAKNRL